MAEFFPVSNTSLKAVSFYELLYVSLAHSSGKSTWALCVDYRSCANLGNIIALVV